MLFLGHSVVGVIWSRCPM